MADETANVADKVADDTSDNDSTMARLNQRFDALEASIDALEALIFPRVRPQPERPKPRLVHTNDQEDNGNG